MKGRLLPILIFLCLFTSAVTQAQPDKPQRHRPHPETRVKVHTYIKENVMPVLRQQRLKLESELSNPDKRQLEALRQQRAALRQQRDAFRKDFKAYRDKKRPALTEAQQKQIQQNREQMEKTSRETRQLAQKYHVAIDRLYAEIATPMQTWETELRVLMDKKSPTRPGLRDHNRMHPVLKEFLTPSAFLLWDVKKSPVPREKTESIESKVYPNPVESTATFSYKVAKAGNVTIQLLDEQGKVIRQLSNGNQTAGRHQIQTDLRTLKSGIYFYHVTAVTGTAMVRFIKK